MPKVKLSDLLPKHKVVINPGKHLMPHAVYDLNEIEKITASHRKVETFTDRAALYSVRTVRKMFDLLTGYNETRF